MTNINPRLIAEALALPKAAEPAPVALETAPLAFTPHCPCSADRASWDYEEMHAAWRVLMGGDERTREAAITFEQQLGWSWMDSTAGFVRELQRHLPGVAPAIGLVAEHVWDTHKADKGRCCAGLYGRDFDPDPAA